jgi:hypothetical protein
LRNTGIAKPQPVLEVQNQRNDKDDERFNVGISRSQT